MQSHFVVVLRCRIASSQAYEAASDMTVIAQQVAAKYIKSAAAIDP